MFTLKFWCILLQKIFLFLNSHFLLHRCVQKNISENKPILVPVLYVLKVLKVRVRVFTNFGHSISTVLQGPSDLFL